MSIKFGDDSYRIYYDTTTKDIVMHTSGTGSIGFTTNQNEQLRIQYGGGVHISNNLISDTSNVHFIYKKAAVVTNNTMDTLLFDTIHQGTNAPNPSSGAFVAPNSGTYLFYGVYFIANNINTASIVNFVKKVGTIDTIVYKIGREGSTTDNNWNGSPKSVQGTFFCYMNKNDTMRMVRDSGTVYIPGYPYGQFGGCLLRQH